jgi:hypothetical protein
VKGTNGGIESKARPTTKIGQSVNNMALPAFDNGGFRVRG